MKGIPIHGNGLYIKMGPGFHSSDKWKSKQMLVSPRNAWKNGAHFAQDTEIILFLIIILQDPIVLSHFPTNENPTHWHIYMWVK